MLRMSQLCDTTRPIFFIVAVGRPYSQYVTKTKGNCPLFFTVDSVTCDDVYFPC